MILKWNGNGEEELLRQSYRFLRFLGQGGSAYAYDALTYLMFSATIVRFGINRSFGRVMVLVHALEKGLSLPNRRDGFGSEKLKELEVWESKLVALPHSKKQAFLLCQIRKIKNDMEQFQAGKFKPAKFERMPPIKPEQFEDFLRSRSSGRFWSGEKVELDKLYSAQRLAVHTPSVCNRQPWGSEVIEDEKAIRQILEIQAGASGFGENASALIIIFSDLAAYWHSHERNQVWIDGGMYAQSFLLALHASGVSACPLNLCLNPIKERKILKMVGLSSNYRLIMAIGVGSVIRAPARVARSERFYPE